MNTPNNKAPISLLAVGVLALAAVTAQGAAAPTLQAHLVLRPLTPGDKTTYSLASSTEVSGGLTTVGVGTPVYLEVDINIAIPAANVTGISWGLTNVPIGSAAVITSSPLGTNIPVYEPSDRVLYQVAGPSARALLRPDLRGPYTVTATVTTTTNGTTNLTQTITAGNYLGVTMCSLCHLPGGSAPDMVTPWKTTAHSQIFSNGIDGWLGHYSSSCLSCHTVGYDTTPSANNGGFDDLAAQLGWVLPTIQTNGNFKALDPRLQARGNIQCENCHGPASEHITALENNSGLPNGPGWPGVSITVASGDCNQCHDAPTHHVKGTEWYVSRHALTTGPTSTSCSPCHSANGFIDRGASSTNFTFASIGCQACHEPHGQTVPTNNPHLLRLLGSVAMPDGTVVTNAGNGALCLQCHHNRNGSVTNQLVNYPLGKPTWPGGSSFGPHDGPQGDMIEGINAVTYGQNIPSSAHRYAVADLCVGCHMQATVAGNPDFLKAGGHTFGMSYSVVTNGVTNVVDKTDVCVQCHGPINTFDIPKQDYNGDGIIEGVQTEVQHMLDKLSTMLPNSTYLASGNYVPAGVVQTSLSVKTNWPAKFLQAAYNWQFVNNDGSLGVHNAPFATGLLKASIANLTGDGNSDGLPDAWQVQYFGSVNSTNAAPNACPAGDGIPNWLKYALGLNPWAAGVQVPGGVVWANGNTLGGNSPTNTVRIYTAAEVNFDTQTNTMYQIQAISNLGGGWQNIGTNFWGTGASVSYLTPTRGNVQQFYRVAHSP